MNAVAAPHLVHVFSTFAPAGPQVRTAKLIDAFGRAFRHTVVAMDGRSDARALLAGEADVRFVDPPPKAGSVATTVRLRALLAAERPDLVLSYNFGAIDAVFAARTLGLGVLHHEDGFRPDEVEGFKRRRVWLRRLALRAPVEVLVISDNLRRIARDLWRIDEERLHFVPNGIEVERFSARDGNLELRRRLGIARSAIVVGAVGHLRPEKNLPRLLRAMARVAADLDLHALLLGDGPERAELEQLAASEALRGRVHFAGYQADPRAHYRAMDVFALTSDTEQMPIALLEAMASGLAVVATDVGDVRSMLPEAQARFVRPATPAVESELGTLLAELAGDETLRAKLGCANRARVTERHSFDTMAGRHRALIEALLAHGRRPH